MWNLFERIINALKPSHQPAQPSQDPSQLAEQLEPWNQDTSEQQHSPEQTVSATQQDE